ncbi:MAG: DUF2232 domain-containing protein [Clostridia bacterium]|nr:DUF2232 domain-containing protein [Clostridia bacterium]
MQNQWLLLIISILLLCVAIAGVLFITGLSMLLFPFLMALHTFIKQNGNKAVSVSFLAISLLLTVLLTNSFLYALLLGALPFVFGSFIALKISKDSSQKQLLLLSGIGVCVFILGMLYSVNNSLNADTISAIYNSALDIFYKNIDAVSQDFTPDLIDEIKILFSQVVAEAKRLFPYTLFTMCAYLGYISLFIITGLNKLFRSGNTFQPRFSEFRCNSSTVFVMVLTAIISFFVKDGILGVALKNIFAIFSFMLTMCAVSLIDYWMKKKNWNIILRILVLLLLISVQSGSFLSVVLSVIAFLDARVNFRKLEL